MNKSKYEMENIKEPQLSMLPIVQAKRVLKKYMHLFEGTYLEDAQEALDRFENYTNDFDNYSESLNTK